jgi:hypothetical protein
MKRDGGPELDAGKCQDIHTWQKLPFPKSLVNKSE